MHVHVRCLLSDTCLPRRLLSDACLDIRRLSTDARSFPLSCLQVYVGSGLLYSILYFHPAPRTYISVWRQSGFFYLFVSFFSSRFLLVLVLSMVEAMHLSTSCVTCDVVSYSRQQLSRHPSLVDVSRRFTVSIKNTRKSVSTSHVLSP